MLYAQTVEAECAAADHDARHTRHDSGTSRVPSRQALTTRPTLATCRRSGELSLVLAIVLTARPPLVLLDELTRGLDYPGKANFARPAATG